MTIQHLVISGGGPIMIQILGAVQYLDENNFLKSSSGSSSKKRYSSKLWPNSVKAMTTIAVPKKPTKLEIDMK
jgi:hypothetical protein